jgi:hypothetical protein
MKRTNKISSFVRFLKDLISTANINIAEDIFEIKDEYEFAANALHEISEYFYQSNASLEKKYFSEFHEYWEKHHRDIIDPQIDEENCYKIALALEKIYKENIIKVQLDTLDLSKSQIADVRYFTTIQDFKIDINAKVNPFRLYKKHPEVFEAKEILKDQNNIDRLLHYIGADDQGDKRRKWMQKAAQLLLEKYDGKAINIAEENDNDVLAVIGALTEGQDKYGYSIKKVNMLIRDLIDLNVWTKLRNVEYLDTMSDQNTMRIALRTGILKTRTPLLSSLLDVYCYQYSLIDEYNRKAWREVWLQWAKIKNNNRPNTPASFDYLIYRMGKKACKKVARICAPNAKIKENTYKKLSDQDKLIFKDGHCMFNSICKNENKILNPPRSISQKQKTGWDNAKTNEGGGGGLSS